MKAFKLLLPVLISVLLSFIALAAEADSKKTEKAPPSSLIIEHGQFLQADAARLMKEKGAFISSFLASVQSDEILTHPVYGKPALSKTAAQLWCMRARPGSPT